ncbi:hypothetical protein L1987_89918 [Smallanthus sonchifolius]|nr:hypothetical protein L1987_89918 [Smallanthus sonchifolius]
MLSKATELLNHGLRERAKAETEMLMAGIDAHNRMLENKPITIERAEGKKSKSLEQGPSSLKTSSSSLFMKQQRSSSARVYDQTLKRVLAKTAFSLPYVKLSFQATTFSSDIEIREGYGYRPESTFTGHGLLNQSGNRFTTSKTENPMIEESTAAKLPKLD